MRLLLSHCAQLSGLGINIDMESEPIAFCCGSWGNWNRLGLWALQGRGGAEGEKFVAQHNTYKFLEALLSDAV